jgi:hypothetical protein
MFRTLTAHETKVNTKLEEDATTRVFHYKKINRIDATSNILCFYIYDQKVFVVLKDKISVSDLLGKYQRDIDIDLNCRNIVVDNTTIYLLYHARIDLYNFNGEKINEWYACSDNSDYCSFAVTEEYIFVTDAENKHIVQYDKEGQLVRFINSPTGFIIPSYSFGIICINDTIYCSNSGRHKIESYTLDGKFIASFGKSGIEAGAFAGCCNPVYLEKSKNGDILTSEKGIPRISSYRRNGKFHTILFDREMLGRGTSAYKMRVWDENIYIASGKTITVYSMKNNFSGENRARVKI